MLFPTFTFAVFFAVVLPVNWALRRRPVPWKMFALGASYWFYAAWDRRFVLLLVAMTLVNAASARATARLSAGSGPAYAPAASPAAARRLLLRRGALTAAVAFDLGVLAFFKYYGFFTESLERNLGLSSPALDIVLPVGVSFFTFQAISYAVDVYRGSAEPAPLLDVAVYLAFFPQLVAGPIVRAGEFLPQLRFGSHSERVELSRAAHLIARGLFKKVVVADYLARAITEDAFGAPGAYGALDVLAGVYGYAVQIYADFSGYTDMAIGVALLLGFRFPQNFDRPYAAVSVRDFWRRWHMTLSRWLRDYLYIPLGGSRKGRVRTYANLLVTMGLGGLWHGAAGVFVVWGLYQGAGLALERLAGEISSTRRRGRVEAGAGAVTLRLPRSGLGAGRRLHRRPAGRAGDVPVGADEAPRRWLRRLLVFHFVCGGWVLFNSPDLGRAAEVFETLVLGWDVGPTLLTPLVAAVIVGAMAAQLAPRRLTRQWPARAAALPTAWTAVAFAVWVMIVVAFGPEGVADYIYFQF